MSLEEHKIESFRLRDDMRRQITEAKERNAPFEVVERMQREEKELDAETRRWTHLLVWIK